MANFNTHLFVAALASTGTATLAINVQLIDLVDAPWLIFIGTIGGLLPDIDSDRSKPAKLLFFTLALISAAIMLSRISPLTSIEHMFSLKSHNCHITTLGISTLLSSLTKQCIPYSSALITLTTFLCVRYPVFFLFKSMTKHRGVFHSILAALFFLLLTTCISYYFLRQDTLFAWLSGLFVAVGFIVHLILDETYSIDLSNTRIKRSFGSALKLFNYKSGYASVSMLICMLALYAITPPAMPFIRALSIASESKSLFTFNFDSTDYLLKLTNWGN